MVGMAREAEFTEGLSVLITKDHKDRLRVIHTGERISEGEVVRDILDAGLAAREALHEQRMASAQA